MRCFEIDSLGKFTSPLNWLNRWVLRLVLWVVVVMMVGCYSRPVAPPLEFDADDVEALQRQIDAIDWDA